LSSSRIVLQVTCGGQENCQVCFPASVSSGCYWSVPERLHLHILVRADIAFGSWSELHIRDIFQKRS